MTSSRRRLAALVVVAATVIGPVPARLARADDISAENLASARDLVRQGREARKAGDFAGALEKFKAAYSLADTPVTAIELARAEAQLGQLVEAREMCLGIARMPIAGDETHLSAAARGEAARMAEDLRPRIPRVVVRVAGLAAGDTAEVTVDGARVPPESLGETRMLDPGAHEIIVRRGNETETAHVTVAERDTREVVVALHGAALVVGPTVAPSDAPSPPPVMAIAAFTIGGIAAVVGIVTGIETFSKESDLSSQCPQKVCTGSAAVELSTASSLGDISTVAFGVAIVGAAVGIYGLLRGTTSAPSPGSAPAASSSISPYLGVGSLGFHGAF